MRFSVAVIGGDGIGPEVTEQAVLALDAIGALYGHVFNFVKLLAGGRAVDETGSPLPDETLKAARECGAVLLGAVGGPRWDSLPEHLRPERGLLGLRAALGVFANLRPVVLFPQLRSACPLKDEVLIASNAEGRPAFDMLIVRELTGGIYFGERGRTGGGRTGRGAAFDTEKYSWEEIERILRAGYGCAMTRRKKLCVVDKANVLESSRLWREVAAEVSGDYPAVQTDYLYVDNAAMRLIRSPGSFDVIVTSNMFGDILSDEASVLTGSIGMLPSASLAGIPAAGISGAGRTGGGAGGDHLPGIYEPIHGSAPDIAGTNSANPLGAVLSAAMMLRYSFGLEREAACLEAAVHQALDKGLRTADIARRGAAAGIGAADGIVGVSEKIAGAREMGEAIVKAIAASGR